MAQFTLADLALATGRSQKRVREVLRGTHGVLLDGVSRWDLSDEQYRTIVDSLERLADALEWPLEIGDTVRRRALHDRYAGQEQGGISTPRLAPEILIFTDPVKGRRYGYDRFEGLRGDGTFAYTGEGRRGDQRFVRGNLAIRDSAEREKTIRLFVTHGPRATYVGSFTTGSPTYSIQTIPDLDDLPRKGIIFNLVPLNADVGYLPPYGAEDNSLWIGAWRPPEVSDLVIAAPEQVSLSERIVTRAEFQLQSDFGTWLAGTGHEPKLLRLPVGSSWVEPDLYVPSKPWIVEAKRSSGREYVRTAIGQVLDYAHLARSVSLEAMPLVLLPGRPAQDLVDLVDSLGILLSYRRDDGFAVVDPN